ncbi:MAG: hypothetical protein AB7O26_02775 [Planctomycetaceae bacterium]
MTIRDRIRELRRVRADSLRANPRNWRTHPKVQQDALKGVLAEVGYAGALLARELEDGSLELIDGHLRAETTPDQMVPVLVLDVDEFEAAKILATHDPLAALAEADSEKLAELLREVETGSPAIEAMLADLARDHKLFGSAESAPAEDETGKLRERFQILIECEDENDQVALLERLSSEGHNCRALIA